MAKIMFLNGVEEKTLKNEGVVEVKRNGFYYRVILLENGKYNIEVLNEYINVVCPLDLPKGTIILTHEENRELRATGKTSHTKGGITYDITSKNGTIVAMVKNEYESVILKSQC